MFEEYLPVIFAVAILVVGGLVGVVAYWAKVRRDQGKADAVIFDIIERALAELRRAFQDEAQKVTTEQLKATAERLYDAYVRPTALSKFISEDRFEQLVFQTWERIVGIQRVVAFALADSGGHRTVPPS